MAFKLEKKKKERCPTGIIDHAARSKECQTGIVEDASKSLCSTPSISQCGLDKCIYRIDDPVSKQFPTPVQISAMH
jgi:hypothetical protein